MQITVDKCEYCGELFENERKYNSHVNIHKHILIIEGAFPIPKLKMREFVQRDKKWYEKLKTAITQAAKKVHPKYLKEKESGNNVLSYNFMRSIGDDESPFYHLVSRLLKICNTCFREYDQPYYAINCKNCGKGENKK